MDLAGGSSVDEPGLVQSEQPEFDSKIFQIISFGSSALLCVKGSISAEIRTRSGSALVVKCKCYFCAKQPPPPS